MLVAPKSHHGLASEVITKAAAISPYPSPVYDSYGFRCIGAILLPGWLVKEIHSGILLFPQGR